VSDSPFHRLAPFLQEFIWTREWAELRPFQVEACRVIFDTDAHLLLTFGTASGKTEAAFLPILTLLHERPSSSVGVLYVSPLKALINDQFLRLGDLLREAKTPVWHWHGDVSQSHKARLLRSPSGILQITPESLEAILLNRLPAIPALFGDLRFVVIDEVHVLMGSDRGRQLLCQLARIARLTGGEPRRVGLSATLGDPGPAGRWLAAGTSRAVEVADEATGERRVRLALDHVLIEPPPDEPADGSDADAAPTAGSAPSELARALYGATNGRKSILFVNSRGDAEESAAGLRQTAAERGEPDNVHVHHGSVASSLRASAEEALRDDDHVTTAVATTTLELGIDIGRLDRVVQLDAPFSVSSFLQRLGRSGRRGQPAELWFVTREREALPTAPLPDHLPWSLLQAIAIVQLYVDERWVEPTPEVALPVSLLYHQTMSTAASFGEKTPAELAGRVLTMPPFAAVGSDDFRELLRHLVATEHLERTEEGGLIVGMAAERVVTNFRFYAVFADDTEWAVREGSTEVGTLQDAPPVETRFRLAGRTWRVEEIDPDRRVVFVTRSRGRAPATWTGGGGDVHTRILQRMRGVLSESTVYPYLSDLAAARLASARDLSRASKLGQQNVVSLGGDAYAVFGWMGTRPWRTFDRLFRRKVADRIGARRIDLNTPYACTFVAPGKSRDAVLDAVRAALDAPLTDEMLLDASDDPLVDKYDPFVPAPLRRRAYARDRLDLAELREIAAAWR